MHEEQHHGISRRTTVRGAAWSIPAVTVLAAAPAVAATPAPPNLSTSQSGGTPTRGTGALETAFIVPPTTFINSGEQSVEGVTVEMTSTVPVTQVTVMNGGLDVTAVGITFEPPLGAGQTSFKMHIPAGTALGQISIAPGDSYTAPMAQEFHTTSTDPTTVQTVATPANGGVPYTPPAFTA